MSDPRTAADEFSAVTVERARRTGSVKWRQYGRDVLAAWVAETDFPPAPVIQRALRRAIDRGYVGYPPADLHTGVPRACADWLATRSPGLAVEPEQIGLVADVLRGLELAIELFSRPGSPVVIPTPSYPPFFEVAQVTGRRVIEVPTLTESDDRPTFDIEGLERALAAGAGTVILCNPHNPLGRAFSGAELVRIADVVANHGARVVADEIHAPLTYPDSRHVPYATVSEAAARHSVTLTSASKGWNVPGLKCAQMVFTNGPDLDVWRRLPMAATQGASTLGVVASLAAYRDGGPWLAELLAYLDTNRRRLAQLLATHLPGVRYRMPEATYLAWLDCRALGQADPAGFFLRAARVAVSDGRDFGRPGAGHVRLNFGTSLPILERVVEAMGAAARGA